MAYYENQIIGKFLFDLGYYVGDTKQKTAGTVNLFQQTPLDPALSDLLLGADSRFFLLEFKKKEKTESEAKKTGIRAHIYQKLLNWSGVSVTLPLKRMGYSKWLEISKSCHYVCLSDSLHSQFIPYVECFFPGKLIGIPYSVYESNHEFIANGIFGLKWSPESRQ